MYCSREYQLTSRFIQQYEKSTPNTEIDYSVETDKDKTLDPTIGDNHKTSTHNMDMTVGEEAIDIKIMIVEMTVKIEADKTLGETSIMTNMTIGIEVGQDEEVWH